MNLAVMQLRLPAASGENSHLQLGHGLAEIRRHDHKGLVNMTTEGIDESLHGLGGIEEIPSNIGVFSRTQQLRLWETRDSGGYS